MAGAYGRDRFAASKDTHMGSLTKRTWDKRMCGQIAWALVLHTLLLIFFVTAKMESEGISILPYFVLILMVGLFIYLGRRMDHRWRFLAKTELSYNSLQLRYRVDTLRVWVMAIGLPFLWSALLAVAQ